MGEASPTTTEDGGQGAVLHDLMQRLLEHQQAFRGFLARRIDDQAMAEDLLQQSLMKALHHHHTLKNEDSAVAWFYRILRHAVIDYYRAKDAEARRGARFEQDAAVLEETLAPPPDEVKAVVCSCLNRLLSALRPAYAELLQRVDLGEESLQSVAKELKITPNNATVRLHRARQALRESLEQACGICSKHGCLNCTCDQP
jgi:RNA polymerase sigma factor (sigma-70 family)